MSSAASDKSRNSKPRGNRNRNRGTKPKPSSDDSDDSKIKSSTLPNFTKKPIKKNYDQSGDKTSKPWPRGQNQKKQQKKKNPFYSSYLSPKETNIGLKNGTMVEGELFVHKVPYVVFVKLENELDIFVSGYKNLNRAFHGDTVIVELIAAPEKEEEDEEAVEFDEDSVQEECEPRKHGKVVRIVTRNHSTELTGAVKGNMFHPLSEKYPWMLMGRDSSVTKEEADGNFVSATIDPKWTLSSRYPHCTITKVVGEIDKFETQYEALKIKNNITHKETFDDALLEGLPLSGWQIPEDELARRLDLRKDLIFSIDPPTARDLDDALSCELLPNGNFKVGVHIADVSYFVAHNSPLDLEARDRGNTVYFVTENVPMLPRILCDELCSLQSNVDRLAFSVIWELTPQGKKLSEEFHRSVIKTVDQLDYATAHEMIHSPDKYAEDPKLKDCAVAVRQLNSIAEHLREERYKNGSLALDGSEIHFDLDEEGNVIGVSPYQRYDSHFLVEEFMLFANISVAERLYTPSQGGIMLRKHPAPDAKKLNEFVEQCKRLNLEVDITSSQTLHESIQKIQQEYNGMTMDAILCMASQPMQSAQYCASLVDLPEDAYHHYALNIPFYCHFTSPIRRYPDLITHRQLGAAIANEPQYLKESLVESIGNHCNDRKREADYASRDCDRLYLNQYLRTKTFIEPGIVVNVSKQQITVLVPKYDIRCNINSKTNEYDSQWVSNAHELVVTWKSNDDDNNKDDKDENDKNKNKKGPSLSLKLLSIIDVELLHTNENFCQTIALRLTRPQKK